MPDPIVHIEIPVNDLSKLRKFYSEVFGWKFKNSKMPGMEYWLIDMGSKQLAGGMYKKTKSDQMPVNYASVKSIDDSIKKLKTAGGKIIMKKMEIPNVGWVAVGFDPSGNPIGLWQDMPPSKKPSKKKK
jgi:predicted enzyme related to lactoylglutathione lyase